MQRTCPHRVFSRPGPSFLPLPALALPRSLAATALLRTLPMRLLWTLPIIGILHSVPLCAWLLPRRLPFRGLLRGVAGGSTAFPFMAVTGCIFVNLFRPDGQNCFFFLSYDTYDEFLNEEGQRIVFR